MRHSIKSRKSWNSSSFNQLVRRRKKLVMTLTLSTIVPYYGFILLATFSPSLLATKISDTSLVNVAWPICSGLMIATWILTGIYSYRANGEFDDLTKLIRKEIEQ